jgi:hypothetical protein
MRDRKILFICGSLNQTTMMHKVSSHFPDDQCFFSPYYSQGFLKYLADSTNVLDFSILGGQFRERTFNYLKKHNLNIDYEGKENDYDLVYTCSDLIVPKNVRNKKLILVQEGMTDPENLIYYLVKYLKLPRWLASTSVTGLSDAYDKFCVASEGYKELFIKKGVNPDKIEITGIPNFDNCKDFLNNDFPHKNFVLVATSDTRETFKYENRKKFIEKAKTIASGKQLIFKLHPNENVERASAEINKYAPGSIIYSSGNTSHMIANCDTLVTRYSSVVYIGLALGKEVFSEFDLDQLMRLVPNQNNGTSSVAIAEIGMKLMADTPSVEMKQKLLRPRHKRKLKPGFRSKLLNVRKTLKEKQI